MQTVPSIPVPPMSSIESLRGRDDPEAIKAVAMEMESLFAYEMIKAMRETTNTSSEGMLGNDTYTSMFDMELSRLFAQRGLGLQEMLGKGLTSIAEKAQNGKSEAKAPEERQSLRTEIKSLLPDQPHLQVSSKYGMRDDPFSGERKFHQGVDIPAPEGTAIHALRQGTVVFSGIQHGYGNVVILDHGEGLMTKYAHNKINLVQEGEKVDAGSVIAQVGTTGKSTGSHVHFEVLYRGRSINPETLLAERQG